MNKVILVGRFTRNSDIRYQNDDNNTMVARFSLAVNRKFKKDAEQKTDYISCVAFGRTAEFVEKHFTKGMKANIVGHIQTGSYKNKEGKTVYTSDVIVEDIEFGENKNTNGEFKAAETGEAPFQQ